MAENIIDEIKHSVSQLLSLYHAYVELHKRDRELAQEMEDYAHRNQQYSLQYQKMVDESPGSARPYYGHIEALIKLSPALDLCMKDHSEQLSESTQQINILTAALNKINELISKGLQNVDSSALRLFHQAENETAKKLLDSFPALEKNHDSIRLRFLTIKRELSRFETPAL